MSETEVFTISIPTDEDGQVLLKCPVCNDLLKWMRQCLEMIVF